MSLVESRYLLPLTRALVTLQAPDSAYRLLQRLKIPKTPGYLVLQFYETHNAIRTEGGLEADTRRVVLMQGGLRAERAVPDKILRKGPPLEQAIRLLDDLGIEYALGFQTAANKHAFFEPSGAHAIYIQQPDQPKQASELKMRIDQAFQKHNKASEKQNYELLIDHLDRLDVRKNKEFNLTSPVQTLLDLAVHTRTSAHREFLFDMLVKQGVIHGR